MSKERDQIMFHVPRDDRYSRLSAHDLKIMRANMVSRGGYSKYDFALVQFWIMQKEDRLPAELQR